MDGDEHDEAPSNDRPWIALCEGSGADRKGQFVVYPDKESPAHSRLVVGDAVDGLDVEHLRVQRDGRLPVGIDIDSFAGDVAHPGMAIVRGVEPDGPTRLGNRSGRRGVEGAAERLEQPRHVRGFLLREKPQRKCQ
jgi:hypothetical protein